VTTAQTTLLISPSVLSPADMSTTTIVKSSQVKQYLLTSKSTEQ